MSDLVPYVVQDFAWDSIIEQKSRVDVTTSGTRVRPRDTYLEPSAHDRFTKFKVDVYQPRVRLDISGAPTSLLDAAQNIPFRQTTLDERPRTAVVARELSQTLFHYDYHYREGTVGGGGTPHEPGDRPHPQPGGGSGGKPR